MIKCRTQRRLAWSVVAVCVVYLVCWVVVEIRGYEMAKARATVATLRADAEKAIDAKDWPAACEAIDKLKTRKPDGEKHACQLRGLMFDDMGKLTEAQIEYQKAYALGDHVAGGSAANCAKRLREGKP